ncbi:hypothetical protein NDU88_001326 [Pleurodeles waltl]|uniref:Uncharacterized protein n=1 Tax=Pleurodeles waltl TaxID=8319 RepID=A0AAV7M0V4_PLEWA|nr:hypothetical protein NDU88_001326 [Pleurodeles waltl]
MLVSADVAKTNINNSWYPRGTNVSMSADQAVVWDTPISDVGLAHRETEQIEEAHIMESEGGSVIGAEQGGPAGENQKDKPGDNEDQDSEAAKSTASDEPASQQDLQPHSWRNVAVPGSGWKYTSTGESLDGQV